MNWKIIIDNWAQITLLLGAVGYIVKAPFELIWKKRESSYSVLMNSQGKAIEQFIEAYVLYDRLIIDGLAMVSLRQSIAEDIRNDVFIKAAEKFGVALNVLRFYLNENEIRPFAQLSVYISKADGLMIDLGHKVADDPTLTDEFLNTEFTNISQLIMDGRKNINVAAMNFRKRFFKQ